MKFFGLIGYGGFGREVMPVADAMLRSQFKADNYELVFVEKSPDISELNGYKVVSEDYFLSLAGDKYFNVAIADSSLREKIAVKYEGEGVAPFPIIAENSANLSNNVIADGAIICPFSMITADARIGRYFHSNIYSYVAHDCRIGDYVTFAPGVRCNGNVIIEDYAYVGTGAIIKHGLPGKPLVIGRGAVVGMGAVVTKDVPPYATVVGNPAKIFERS